MRLWKRSLVFVSVIAASLVVGCASESKRAREDARVEARAQELAEQIVRKVKAVDTVKTVTPTAEKTLDKRLINPPGTLWMLIPGGSGSDAERYFIFYATGRWVDPVYRENKGYWHTERNLIVLSGGYFHEFASLSYTFEENPKDEDSFGGIRLKLNDLKETLTLCAPNAQIGCWGIEAGILERVEIELDSLERLVNR